MAKINVLAVKNGYVTSLYGKVAVYKIEEPKPAGLVMVIDDLVAAGELTATGSAIGSVTTLSNGIVLHEKAICRTASNYNYEGGKRYNAAIRLTNAQSGGMDLDITNYTKLTLIGRSSSASSPRTFRIWVPGYTGYITYSDMQFHDPNAGDVSNAVTLAEFDLTEIKNTSGNNIMLAFSGNADICELRLE